jgi:hypothetical protein
MRGLGVFTCHFDFALTLQAAKAEVHVKADASYAVNCLAFSALTCSLSLYYIPPQHFGLILDARLARNLHDLICCSWFGFALATQGFNMKLDSLSWHPSPSS